MPPAARAELLLVRSGAYRDLGQAQPALDALEVGELDSPAIKPWTVRLWYGYARSARRSRPRRDAAEWFAAVAAVDDGETDAADRVVEISGRRRSSIRLTFSTDWLRRSPRARLRGQGSST